MIDENNHIKLYKFCVKIRKVNIFYGQLYVDEPYTQLFFLKKQLKQRPKEHELNVYYAEFKGLDVTLAKVCKFRNNTIIFSFMMQHFFSFCIHARGLKSLGQPIFNCLRSLRRPLQTLIETV